MNRTRSLATAFLMLAMSAVGQQATTRAGGSTKSAASQQTLAPTAQEQLTFLTAKLALTGEQQDKVKPILRELHDATVKLVHDETLSREERLGKIKDSHYTADKKIRLILNDDQKKNLDQVEQEPHPELHGNLSDSKD